MNRVRARSKSTLGFGAFALFFLSFLMSANSNVLPQLFFEQNDPAQKTLLLSRALFLATLASVAGVLISRRVRSRRLAIVISLLLTAGLLEAQLAASGAVFFTVSLVLIQFADNFLLNQIDHAAVARAGPLRGFNDGAGNAARLFGMLSAPAFFTILASRPAIEGLTVAVLGMMAAAGCIPLFALEPVAEASDHETSAKREPDRIDWLVFAYAIAIYIALYLFAANMIYLLRDLFHIANSATRGGIAIVGVFLGALAANGIVAAIKRPAAGTGSRSIRVGPLSVPAILLIIVSTLMLAGVRTGYAAFLAIAMLIGAAYGVFLWEVRDYSSRAANLGNTTLLTWFNNMANISSLFAFGLMLILAAARSHSSDTYYALLMWAIAFVPAAGLCLLTMAAAQLRRAAEPSEEVLKPA